MEEMADLSNNSSSSHGQNGKIMEAVEYKEDGGMPDAIRILVEEFEAESLEMRWKIHKLPASLADMGDQFVVPMALAIGPYHHNLPRLQGMEKVKRVAAYTLSGDLGGSRDFMYSQILAVAEQAHRLYADDAVSVSHFSKTEFADMMFHDACFLLQYMRSYSREEEEEEVEEEEEEKEKRMNRTALQRFFLSNQACINNDIMLLENQLPWFVIIALRDAKTTFVDVEPFIRNMGISMGRKSLMIDAIMLLNMLPSPHLLGLLRLCKQGEQLEKPTIQGEVVQSSVAISAMELEGIGMKLEYSKTDKFDDMGINNGFLFDKLFLPRLTLDRIRASWLANMVAFEVCTASYSSQSTNDSVCSYVAFLAMLMDTEEDVHKLRSEGFIHGELSDKQILEFFNGLAQQMSPGAGYFHILADIEARKRKRWLRIMVCKFVSDNAKAIAAVLSIIGVLVGIFKALYSLKQH